MLQCWPCHLLPAGHSALNLLAIVHKHSTPALLYKRNMSAPPKLLRVLHTFHSSSSLGILMHASRRVLIPKHECQKHAGGMQCCSPDMSNSISLLTGVAHATAHSPYCTMAPSCACCRSQSGQGQRSQTHMVPSERQSEQAHWHQPHEAGSTIARHSHRLERSALRAATAGRLVALRGWALAFAVCFGGALAGEALFGLGPDAFWDCTTCTLYHALADAVQGWCRRMQRALHCMR